MQDGLKVCPPGGLGPARGGPRALRNRTGKAASQGNADRTARWAWGAVCTLPPHDPSRRHGGASFRGSSGLCGWGCFYRRPPLILHRQSPGREKHPSGGEVASGQYVFLDSLFLGFCCCFGIARNRTGTLSHLTAKSLQDGRRDPPPEESGPFRLSPCQ